VAVPVLSSRWRSAAAHARSVEALTEIPPLQSPALVGRACNMSRRSAKSLLLAAGVLKLVGARWYVGEARLRERLPDVYDRVVEYLMMPLAGPRLGSVR